ncbi:hypothetical protein QEG73_08910 [Chitinophagaceae bacterium 26-R-25]|nr:hypothetical protein [Chitinophagaceae bacterium 26-R-25]
MYLMNAKQRPFISILLLLLVAVVVYYPVFLNTYAYTDESAGLWQFRTGNEHTLIQFGRLITEKMAVRLFGSINTINELLFIRLFSFCGWLLSVPVWYFIIKKICNRESLPDSMPFLATLFLICMPAVTSSIVWSACFEMFLANTAGLVSGYFLYAAIKFENGRVEVGSKFLIISIALGVVSLFTYQNCFGCFLLPFALQLIANNKINRSVIIGVVMYFVILVVYYMLYKYSLKAYGIGPNDRTAFNTNVPRKLLYFLVMPLKSSFLFNVILNEVSIVGFVAYIVVAAGVLILYFFQQRKMAVSDSVKTLLCLVLLFILIYFPSLIAKENYASNRTLFALNMAVFLSVFTIIANAFKKQKALFAFVIAGAIFFAGNAFYNVRCQFLKPVVNEFAQVKNFLISNYHNDIDTVYFIRPHQDFFEKKYGINRSWDEFGVPSTFFDWTPIFLTKLLIYERTNDRALAEKIVVKSWLGKEEFENAKPVLSKNTLLVDVEDILSND